MTLKLTKFMTEAYFINKFYIWIQNWTVSVKYAFSFSSSSSYQQPQGSNNTHFFTFHYPSTASAATSEIKPIISSVLFTAVVSTTTCNYISTISSSYFWISLNESKRNCCCDNNLCFYCRESDYWLSNCLWKCIICVNEITFQIPSSGQLAIKASLILTNTFELCLENEWNTWIVAQETSN